MAARDRDGPAAYLGYRRVNRAVGPIVVAFLGTQPLGDFVVTNRVAASVAQHPLAAPGPPRAGRGPFDSVERWTGQRQTRMSA